MFLVTSFVLATGGVTFAQMAPTPKKGPEMSMPAADDRQAIAVSEPTRVFVLAEMRGMLASVQGVTEAIARRDWQAAIDAAGKTGLKAFEGMPKPIMMELPEDFRIMGRETHMAFDEGQDRKRNPRALGCECETGRCPAVLRSLPSNLSVYGQELNVPMLAVAGETCRLHNLDHASSALR